MLVLALARVQGNATPVLIVVVMLLDDVQVPAILCHRLVPCLVITGIGLTLHFGLDVISLVPVGGPGLGVYNSPHGSG